MDNFNSIDISTLQTLVEMAVGTDLVIFSSSRNVDEDTVHGRFDTQDDTFFISINKDREISVWDQNESDYEVTEEMLDMI